MRFVMWNVRSLYWAGPFMTVAKEISKYKLDIMVYRMSDGTKVGPNQQGLLHLSETETQAVII
jgi:hypothetical protein